MMWMLCEGVMQRVRLESDEAAGLVKRREYRTPPFRRSCRSWRLDGLAVAVVAAAFVAPALDAQEAPDTPLLAVTSTVHDFGVVDSGVTLHHEFPLFNRGGGELRIHRVESTCSCTVHGFDPVIAAGEAGAISVELLTAGQEGPFAVHLDAFTNDTANARLTLTLKAEVKAGVVARPGYVRFVETLGFEEASATQTVMALDSTTFGVVGLRSPYPFVTGSVREASADERDPEASGSQWLVQWTLDGSAPVGPLAGFLEVEIAGRDERLAIPINGFVRPPFEWQPETADLGSFSAAEGGRTSVRLKSYRDTGALTEASTTVPGLATEIVREPGGIWFVVVTAGPSAVSGRFDGAIEILTNDANMQRIEVPVRGVAR
jgi:hypothetical protein